MTTETDLILTGVLAAVWLSAGLTADSLPTAATAATLHRRTRTVCWLVAAGAALFVAIPVLHAATPGGSAVPAAAFLALVPAMVVLTLTLRHLTAVRQGASAFATAPLTPMPHALRAAAAHPMVAAPLQVTGLAALAGMPIAAGVVAVPGAEVAAVATAVAAIVVVTVGVRHALRHSRLSLKVVAPMTARRRPL